jgi:hypothetical protein
VSASVSSTCRFCALSSGVALDATSSSQRAGGVNIALQQQDVELRTEDIQVLNDADGVAACLVGSATKPTLSPYNHRTILG